MSRSILIAALLLGACGHRSFLDLVAAEATRGADDHVVVDATLTCEPMIDTSCEVFAEYCVEARWERAGAIVDTARTCSRTPLAAAVPARLTVRSTRPIPRGDTTIALATSWTGSGTGQLRDKLHANPLPSP